MLGACAAAAALLAVAPPRPAAAGGQPETFRIGMVAEPGAANTVAGLGMLTDAYSKALGMKVEFLVARDYGALIEAQAAGQVQYAVYSALAYAAASQRCGCVVPLAAPTDADGAIGIRSILIARDGKVTGPDGLASHEVAVAPRENVAGWLLPMAELAGLETGLSGNPPFLRRGASASQAEAMLRDGAADALFGWQPAAADGAADPPGGTLARLEAAGIDPSALKVVWKSGLLRYGPHAVLKSLDPELRRRLGVFLINLRAQSPEIYDLLETRHSGGFAVTGEADYHSAEAVLRAISAEGQAPQGR